MLKTPAPSASIPMTIKIQVAMLTIPPINGIPANEAGKALATKRKMLPTIPIIPKIRNKIAAAVIVPARPNMNHGGNGGG